MPIDHDARLPIPRMPFGEEILVPRAEVARVRSARRDVFAPELGEPRLKEPIDDRCNTLSHGFRSDKATPDVEEIFVREPLVPHVDALQPCPGSKPIQREEEPVLEGGPVEVSHAVGLRKKRVKSTRRSVSLRTSRRLVIGHRVLISVLRASKLVGSGWGARGESLIHPLAFGRISTSGLRGRVRSNAVSSSCISC